MSLQSINKDIAEAITAASAKKTEPYDTEATVRRIEGGTAWVHIPGGVDETPVALTISAQAGDTVRVRVSGGSAWIVGNDTAPPTDDTTAEAAQETANTAQTIARTASLNADAAKKIAGNTNQYFWHTETGTDTGAHITEIPQDDFLADPESGGGNLLARSNGIAVRDGLTELATFGAAGAQIGLGDESHLIQDFHSLQLVDMEGTTYFHVSDLRNADGSLTETFTGDSTTYIFTLKTTANSIISVTVLGVETAYTWSGRNVTITPAPGIGYPIVIKYMPSSTLVKAYTLGVRNSSKRVGIMSVAEGLNTEASGDMSHAEGSDAHATGAVSHAEGCETYAMGDYSHAEGYGTSASYDYSHASGLNVNTYDDAQTAIGKNNAYAANSALLIGNGPSISDSSNAVRVQWNGITHFQTRDRSAQIGTDIPSGSSQLGGFSWYDKDGKLCGYNQIIKTAADMVYMNIAAARPNADGDSLRNGFYLRIKADESQEVGFYNAESRKAWLDALGIGNTESSAPSANITGVGSGAATAVCDVSLSAGTWLVVGRVSYQVAGTAGTYRQARLGSTSTGTQYATASVPGSSAGNTIVEVTTVVVLSSAGTVYLSGMQGGSSSGVITTGSNIKAVKIGY